jgi:hypothetical protein
MTMSKLSIKFQPYAADSGSARVPMEVIDHNLEQVWAQSHKLRDEAEVDVAPGTYLVRAHLPSGEIVSAQAQVGENETKKIDLIPKQHSPQESLGWAYYLKGVSRTGQPVNKSFSFEAALRGIGEESAGAESLSTPKLNLYFHHAKSGWHSLSALEDTHNLKLPKADFPLEVEVDRAIRYLDPLTPVSLRLKTKRPLRKCPGQLWLRVGGDEPWSKFVALPSAKELRVLVTLDDDEPQQSDDPLNVIVDSGNPQAEAILGYLSSGDFGSAKLVGGQVVESAVQLLWDKVDDPTGAAIGGYLLLATEHLFKVNWTNNLANWMEWLPDGAVIHAWHVLRQKKGDGKLARKWLIEAAKRGVPLYTQGLRLLFDGLNIFDMRADGKDKDVKAALERIRPYAAAADWRTPVTTFFGKDPAKPEPLLRTR